MDTTIHEQTEVLVIEMYNMAKLWSASVHQAAGLNKAEVSIFEGSLRSLRTRASAAEKPGLSRLSSERVAIKFLTDAHSSFSNAASVYRRSLTVMGL